MRAGGILTGPYGYPWLGHSLTCPPPHTHTGCRVSGLQWEASRECCCLGVFLVAESPGTISELRHPPLILDEKASVQGFLRGLPVAPVPAHTARA